MGNNPGSPPRSSNGHAHNQGSGSSDVPLASSSGPTYHPVMPRYKVLIVEDAVDLAEVLRTTLERMNLQVFHESHGLQALAVYQAEHPDLVLLDIALPDTTGWKVLDTIREQQHSEKLPVIIVITAYDDPANRLMGKLQGIHSYLIKPFTPDELERAVVKALNLTV